MGTQTESGIVVVWYVLYFEELRSIERSFVIKANNHFFVGHGSNIVRSGPLV